MGKVEKLARLNETTTEQVNPNLRRDNYEPERCPRGSPADQHLWMRDRGNVGEMKYLKSITVFIFLTGRNGGSFPKLWAAQFRDGRSSRVYEKKLRVFHLHALNPIKVCA